MTAARSAPTDYHARLAELKRTLGRWRDSRVAFGREALRVRDKMSPSLVPFADRPVQLILEAAVSEAEARMRAEPDRHHPARFVILKARKEGVSTWIQKFIYHRTMFVPSTEAIVICHEREASENVLRMARRFHANMPPQFRLRLESDARSLLEWEHDSLIQVKTAGTPESSRSYSPSILHCSEHAMWPEPERTMTALGGSIAEASWTYVFYESTANGHNEFKELWDRAMLPHDDPRWNGCTAIFFPWFADPTHTVDLAPDREDRRLVLTEAEAAMVARFGLTLGQAVWYRQTLARKYDGDLDRMRQEMPSTPDEAFVASGGGVFHGPSVSTLANLAARVPAMHYTAALDETRRTATLSPVTHGPLCVWAMPADGAEYVIGVDTAAGAGRGDGGDYSVCDVWRRVNEARMAQVACYASNTIIPTEFAAVVDAMLSMYTVPDALGVMHEPYTMPEADHLGRLVIAELLHRGRSRFYRREMSPEVLRESSGEVLTIGYLPTPQNKPYLVDTLRAAVLRCDALAQAPELFVELRAFIAVDSGTSVAYKAAGRAHDDRVIAAALAWLGHGQLGPVHTAPAPVAPMTAAQREWAWVMRSLAQRRGLVRGGGADGGGKAWVHDSVLGRLRVR